MDVLLGLGSNSDFAGLSPVELIAAGVSSLSRLVKDMKISSLYRTRAMYVEAQESFFNAVIYGKVSSSLSPFSFLEKIHRIEAEFGRDREKEIRFGPRSLDIDIEEFGDMKIDSDSLTLPHPRLHERAFVLVPALEIFSESADEKKKERFASLLVKLPDQGVEKCPEEIQVRFRNLIRIETR